MNTLKIDNNYSWLLSDNKKIKEILHESLRFRTLDYIHNRRYRMKLWDGYKDFFIKNSGRFLTGLLPEVVSALKYLNEDFTILDKRKPVKWAVDSIDENFLKDVGITLRDYQVELVNKVIEHNRGLIYSPTSSGKTNLASCVVKALPPGTPVLFLGNKKSLVEQNYEELVAKGIKNVGRYYSEIKEPNIITCATIQSAKNLEPILGKVRVLLVDEIHEMMSKVCKDLYPKLKSCYVRVAMSATPFKFGGKDLVQKYETKGWFGAPFVIKSAVEDGKLTTKELQRRNILSKARCKFIPVTEPLLEYCVYQDAVTQGIAENEIFHKQVCDIVSGLSGRTLIIVERISHGDRLNELLPGSLWVRGQDNQKTRKEVIERLKVSEGNVVAIASSGIFNTGLNCFIHNLINAAGGKAEHQIIQRFGRGLRTAKDKDILNYYDFIFHNNKDYLLKHSIKRIDILRNEGHDVEVNDG